MSKKTTSKTKKTLTKKDETTLRGHIAAAVRKAILKGEWDVTLDDADCDDSTVSFSVIKCRENGESFVEVTADYGDCWDGSGEKQADFLDDLIEDVTGSVIDWYRDDVLPYREEE